MDRTYSVADLSHLMSMDCCQFNLLILFSRLLILGQISVT